MLESINISEFKDIDIDYILLRNPLTLHIKWHNNDLYIINNHFKCCGDGFIQMELLFECDEDEERYLQEKTLLMLQSSISGSGDNGLSLIRDATETILLFENPSQDQLPEDPSTQLIYNLSVKLLKTRESDTIINEVLDRAFREL